jgi:uncharacterized protein YoxC
MITSALDILYLSLAIGFMVFIIFLCMTLFYVISILRDVSKVTNKVEELVKRVHHTIIQPLRAVDYIIEKISPYVETLVKNKVKERKNRKNRN